MFTATIYINEFSMSDSFQTLAEARAFVRANPCDDFEITDGDKQYEAVAPAIH